MTTSRTIAVIGTGYVGLITGMGLASLGHRIRFADIDEQRISALRLGRAPIYEDGLEDMLEKYRERVTFTTDNLEAVDEADFVFLSLPTPESEDRSADLSAIRDVVDQVISTLQPGSVLVVKSTVPPGTTAEISAKVEASRDDVTVVAHPEFLREGRAIQDFLQPDRLVFGGPRSACESVSSLYQGLGDVPQVITDPTSAEMIKYASNSYLAARLTFVNTLSKVSEVVGADIVEVTRGMGFDERIGTHFLRPGPGFGGSCFPKDTAALVAMTAEKGYRFGLLEAIIEADEETREAIIDKVAGAVGGDLMGKTVGMWGVAFKANTDDTRESPAIKLGTGLADRGAKVVAHDPKATTDLFEMRSDPIEAARGADVLLVATEWKDYLSVDLDRVAEAMQGDVVVDARNHLDAENVGAAGLRYSGVGRPGLSTL